MQILKQTTTLNYGWSYIVSWVGIGFVLIASLLMLGAYRAMKVGGPLALFLSSSAPNYPLMESVAYLRWRKLCRIVPNSTMRVLCSWLGKGGEDGSSRQQRPTPFGRRRRWRRSVLSEPSCAVRLK